MELLDEIDRKVLFELDRNSRQSYAEIGRRIHVIPETVKYRIDGLVKRGIIRNFFSTIDSSKLGFVHFKLFVRLQAVGDKHLDEIVTFFKRSQLCLRLSLFDGEYDLGGVFKVSKLDKIDSLILDMKSRFGQFIGGRSFAMNVWGQYLPRTDLIEKPRNAPYKVRYQGSNDYYSLDRSDKLILKELSADSRVTATAISKQLQNSDKLLPLSVETVTQRIKKLEKDKIITGYGVLLNQEKLGKMGFKVLLYLNAPTSAQIDEFILYCQNQPIVVHIVRTLGEWDFDIDLEVSEFRDCRALIMELSNKFPNMIRHYIPLRYLSYEKFTFFTSSSA